MKKFTKVLLLSLLSLVACQQETQSILEEDSEPTTNTDIYRFSIITEPTKTSYFKGDTLNLDGLSAKVTYLTFDASSDKSFEYHLCYYTKEPENFAVSDISGLDIGMHSVECTYNGFAFLLKIQIDEGREKSAYNTNLVAFSSGNIAGLTSDAYSCATATITDNKATFSADTNGKILIEPAE